MTLFYFRNSVRFKFLFLTSGSLSTGCTLPPSRYFRLPVKKELFCSWSGSNLLLAMMSFTMVLCGLGEIRVLSQLSLKGSHGLF